MRAAGESSSENRKELGVDGSESFQSVMFGIKARTLVFFSVSS